jgi:hypothetical protein
MKYGRGTALPEHASAQNQRRASNGRRPQLGSGDASRRAKDPVKTKLARAAPHWDTLAPLAALERAQPPRNPLAARGSRAKEIPPLHAPVEMEPAQLNDFTLLVNYPAANFRGFFASNSQLSLICAALYISITLGIRANGSAPAIRWRRGTPESLVAESPG